MVVRPVVLRLSAVQAIIDGDANIVLAGVQESMSMSMHCQSLRLGHKMGNLEIVYTMIKDGLTDVFNGYHMGITAENLAEQYQVSREAQDTLAVRSQNLAEASRAIAPLKAEIEPTTITSRTRKTNITSKQTIPPQQ